MYMDWNMWIKSAIKRPMHLRKPYSENCFGWIVLAFRPTCSVLFLCLMLFTFRVISMLNAAFHTPAAFHRIRSNHEFTKLDTNIFIMLKWYEDRMGQHIKAVLGPGCWGTSDFIGAFIYLVICTNLK